MANSENISVLNDLIQINNDRITGYEKAIKELDGERSDLSSVYSRMGAQSQKIKNDLQQAVATEGGEIATGQTISGSIYQTWMDVRSAFSSKKEQTSLDLSEFGEDAAQSAYKKALENDALSAEVRQLITAQKAELLASHDEIKALRDAEKVTHN